MAYGIICQNCGIEAPSKHVAFHQNIGAVFMRFHKTCKGNLCKRCVHAKFWSMTGTTFAIGWLGTISIVLGPIFVIMNTVQYLGALGMPRVPEGAKRPALTNDVIARIYPRAGEIFDRVNRGEDLIAIAQQVAGQVGVTPGEVVLYTLGLARQQPQPPPQQQAPARMPPPMPTGGFPVVQTQAQAPAQVQAAQAQIGATGQ